MENVKSMLLSAGVVAMFATSCSQSTQSNLTVSGLEPDKFVSEVRGEKTGLFTLTNQNGMEVCVTNFGGRIVSIMVPDKND